MTTDPNRRYHEPDDDVIWDDEDEDGYIVDDGDYDDYLDDLNKDFLYGDYDEGDEVV